jgi:hypothetical protein
MAIPDLKFPFRNLCPPLEAKSFRPLEEWVNTVQFCDPLSEDEHKQVAEFLLKYPDVSLRAFGRPEGVETLEFLKHYPSVRHLEVDLYLLKSTAGIEYASEQLESFAFSQTKSKAHSLSFIKRFKNLTNVSLESHAKDINVLSGLQHLNALHLRSITLPDLDLIKPLVGLRALTLKLGGTKNLTALRGLPDLRYLEVWMVRGLADLSVLADMKSLTHLFLQSLTQVKELPSLSQLKSLRWVTVEALKNLTDLNGIAQAPNLEELSLWDMGHLRLPNLEPFVGHKTLRAAGMGLGSLKRNEAADHLLGVSDKVTDKFAAYKDAVTGDKK